MVIKTIKKVVLSAFSILGISLLVWTFILLNPHVAYSNETQVDIVTIYHNQPLENGTKEVIEDAIAIIKKSPLFNDDIALELCLNDGSYYPGINPLTGKPLAYAMLSTTVLYNCTPKFDKNIAESQWAINNYELRKFDLTYLIAHEFMHNLQFNTNFKYVVSKTLGTIFWKFEGHADYVARQYQNDGKLKERINTFLDEEMKEHVGLPVFKLEDGTEQILSYFKYSLVIQYLMEQEKLSYLDICKDERTLEEVYGTMIEWSKK